MSNTTKKLSGLAMAGLLATTLSACKEDTAEAKPMVQGYQNTSTTDTAKAGESTTNTANASTKAGEGKCGEGKCGEAGCSATMSDKAGEGKCGEGKCGADSKPADKNANASCGGAK